MKSTIRTTSAKSTITLDELQIAWEARIADCGETKKRELRDDTSGITWKSVFNENRMSRRYLPKKKLIGCLFCNAIKTDESKLATTEYFSIYGNKYPIEPLHLLLFNDKHKEDPSKEELVAMLSLAKKIPDLRILLSNRLGSGASFPSHFHVHAFVIELPIEHAANVYKEKNEIFELGILNYPAWTVKMRHKDENKTAELIDAIIKKFSCPFNIDIIGDDIYIMPRKVEQPLICENLVDGVGALETAGVYSVISEESLHALTVRTFTEGLADAGYSGNRQFQDNFLYYCLEILKS